MAKRRGRKPGRGYTLKDNNKNGNWYVYVWGEYNNEKSKERRQEGSKGASYYDNYVSLGRWGKQDTVEKLEQHLRIKYGQEFTEDKLDSFVEDIDIEVTKKECVRKYKEHFINELMNLHKIEAKEARKLVNQELKNELNELKSKGYSHTDAKYIQQKQMIANYYELESEGVLL